MTHPQTQTAEAGDVTTLREALGNPFVTMMFGDGMPYMKLKYKTADEVYAANDALDALAASPAPRAPAAVPAYGIIDPDYARVFTVARCIAWSEGYALLMHGSFTRDLDLLAVPWAEQATDAEHLVRRISVALDDLDLLVKDPKAPSQATEKPHGRLAWTFTFKTFGDPRFVDLSVIPRTLAAAPAAPPTDGGTTSFGYLFHNPDTGVEWSASHPVESGECEDATDIRPATLEHLYDEMIGAWAMLAEHEAQRAQRDRLRYQLETADNALARIWKILGIANYAEAGGKDIAEIVAERISSRTPAGAAGDLAETDALVDRFATALKAKLRASEAKYGWQNGWLKAGWEAECQCGLAHHITKGDPLDVAAYTAFCWHHGWPTWAPRNYSDETTGAVVPSLEGEAAYQARFPGAPLSDCPDWAIDAWNRVALAAISARDAGEAAESDQTSAIALEAWRQLKPCPSDESDALCSFPSCNCAAQRLTYSASHTSFASPSLRTRIIQIMLDEIAGDEERNPAGVPVYGIDEAADKIMAAIGEAQ